MEYDYSNGRVSDIQIAYIGGGSQGWAWTLMNDLAKEELLDGTVRLYDIDQEGSHKNEIIGNHLSSRENIKGKWSYRAVPSLKEALEGADFVVISILPGTLEEMDSDVHLPESLGIWQSVGDTTGPGGVIRSLRTIPMFAQFAQAIREYAPQAWVINFTNPMTLCVKTLYHIFPEIKAFGCCHEVFGTQNLLKDVLKAATGIEADSRDDIHVNVLGINHFTWFDSASYKGIDLFPIYREFIAHNSGADLESDTNWFDRQFKSTQNVKFDLFRRYGLIAAAGDSHLVEFMPGDTYLKDQDTIKEWGFRMKLVSNRKKQAADRLERRERLASFEEEFTLEDSGEEALKLIKAILGLERVISNVNVPNTAGQIENLPKDAVVETNALFARDAVRPIAAGRIPDNVLELVMPHVENHERVLKAALACDRELAFEAFRKDPNVAARGIGEDSLRGLFDQMIGNTLGYLPDGWK